MGELLEIILTSTVVSAIISSVVALVLKNVDFKNEYYKEIIKKRLEAYGYVERQIAVLKSSAIDDDNKPCHLIFFYGADKFLEFQDNLFAAMSYGMWIDKETIKELERLNDLFFTINCKIKNKTETELINIGKEYHKTILTSRNNLEQATKKGLYEITNMKKMFKVTKQKNK